MDKNKKTLMLTGQRIKKLRLEKELSQEKLASKAGLHPTYVSQVERGIRNPTLVSLAKIAKALDCSLSNLLEGITY